MIIFFIKNKKKIYNCKNKENNLLNNNRKQIYIDIYKIDINYCKINRNSSLYYYYYYYYYYHYHYYN